MSRDAFRRFFLVAGCTGYALALALVWKFLGWPYSLAVALLGPLYATLFSVEATPARGPASSSTATEPRGLSLAEIRQRAREAGDG